MIRESASGDEKIKERIENTFATNLSFELMFTP
jgi:hypothetical protein